MRVLDMFIIELRGCRDGQELVSKCVLSTVCHVQKPIFVFVLCVDGAHGSTRNVVRRKDETMNGYLITENSL